MPHVVVLRVEDQVRAHPARDLHARLVDPDDDHERGPARSRHPGREEAGRTVAEDQDRPGGDRLDEGRVDRVAERFLRGGDLGRDRAIVLPDDEGRDRDVLGETSVAVDAEDLEIAADVHLSGHALHAMHAGDVGLRRDEIPDLPARDGGSDLDDFAGEFVTECLRHRPDARLRPFVPLIDVDVGPADARSLDSDQDLTREDPRNRDLFDLRSGLPPPLHNRPHHLGHHWNSFRSEELLPTTPTLPAV